MDWSYTDPQNVRQEIQMPEYEPIPPQYNYGKTVFELMAAVDGMVK